MFIYQYNNNGYTYIAQIKWLHSVLHFYTDLNFFTTLLNCEIFLFKKKSDIIEAII